jgi:hypothetical protein
MQMFLNSLHVAKGKLTGYKFSHEILENTKVSDRVSLNLYTQLKQCI